LAKITDIQASSDNRTGFSNYVRSLCVGSTAEFSVSSVDSGGSLLEITTAREVLM